MNRVLDKRRELLAILFVVALLWFTTLFRSTSYAAVADVVTSDKQITYGGIKYPSDGATITNTSTSSNNLVGELYSDGTLYLYGTKSYSYGPNDFYYTGFGTTDEIVNIVVGDGVSSIYATYQSGKFQNLDTVFISDKITRGNVYLYGSGSIGARAKRVINLNKNPDFKVDLSFYSDDSSLFYNLQYTNLGSELKLYATAKELNLFSVDTVIDGEMFGAGIKPFRVNSIRGKILNGKYTPYAEDITKTYDSKFYTYANMLQNLEFESYYIPDDTKYGTATNNCYKISNDSDTNLYDAAGNLLLLSPSVIKSGNVINTSDYTFGLASDYALTSGNRALKKPGLILNIDTDYTAKTPIYADKLYVTGNLTSTREIYANEMNIEDETNTVNLVEVTVNDNLNINNPNVRITNFKKVGTLNLGEKATKIYIRSTNKVIANTLNVEYKCNLDIDGSMCNVVNINLAEGIDIPANMLKGRTNSVPLVITFNGSVNNIGDYGLVNAEIKDAIEVKGNVGSNALAGAKFTNGHEILLSNSTIGTSSFINTKGLSKLVISNSKNKFNTSMVKGSQDLSAIYLINTEIEATSLKADLPSTSKIYCASDSIVETWCKNNSVAYKIMTDEEINEITKGQLPTLESDSKLVDFDAISDIDFIVDLGKKPAGASGIKKVMIDNKTLTNDTDYTFNGTDTITIKSEYLRKLYNGTHAVSVLFDNGTFKSGASIYVMSSTVPVIDPTKPPVALDTVKYEFYKDYPDYLIIPVSLNGATKVTKLKIGSEVVDPDEYYLYDGAIVISYDYLSTLDAGKYRILPTFDDPAITTLNNIQLLVYENAADRAAPYLLQTRIIFRGQNFGLRFDAGVGDLETSNVLALVIDNQMLLPDGRLLPLSSSNVSKVKKIVIDDIVASPSEATRKSKVIYTVTPEEINTASPSEATNQTMSLMSSSMHVMSSQPEEAFYVVDNEIHVSGNAISSMKLAEGDHLMGAIFDNTEKTSDVRKVILSIMSDKDNGTETPGNNENPGNNETPGNNNGSNNGGYSGSGGNSGSGSHGSNSGGGGSGSGGSSNGPGAKGEDSKVKPVVRDDGGSYNVNPNDPKDVTYTDKDGNPTPNKWVGDGQNWRHTNKDSKLDYGWFLDVDGSWYLLTKEAGKDFGTAWYGWFHENQDGKWYYLSTKDNKMAKGKVKIDGKDYNFNPTNQEPTYYGDNKNGWIYDQTKGLPVGCWIEDIK